MVEFLLGKGAQPDQKETNCSTTPLICASENGSPEIVQMLLNQGADVNRRDYDNQTALMKATKEGHTEIVRILLEHKALPDLKNNEQNTALRIAANGAWLNGYLNYDKTHYKYKDYTPIIKLLLLHGANPHIRCGEYSPVGHLLSVGNREIVSLIIEKSSQEDLATMFEAAASAGSKETVELLLDQGVQVDVQNKKGQTTLMLAATKDQSTETVQILLDRGAQVNTPDQDGKSALMYAAEGKNLETVRLLLSRGASITQRDKEGRTALTYAVSKAHFSHENGIEITEELLDRCDDPVTLVNLPDTHKNTALMYATNHYSEKREVVEMLLRRGALVSSINDEGHTVLWYAVGRGHTAVAKLLLEHGAQDDIQAMLTLAATAGHADMFQMLLSLGTPVPDREKALAYGPTRGHNAHDFILDLPAQEKLTAVLTQAVTKELLEEISRPSYSSYGLESLLREKGHCVDIPCLLQRSASWLTTENVKLLLKHTTAKDRATLLMQAAIAGKTKVVKMLVKQGTPVDTFDDQGKTALMHAAQRGHKEVVEWLLAHDAQLTVKDHGERTVLMWAAESRYSDTLAFILGHNQGALDETLNAQDSKGLTPLMIASCRSKKCVKLLLDRKAHVHTKDIDGRTALMHSAQAGKKGIVSMLLEASAEVDAQGTYGLTALLLTSKPAVASILLEHGADIQRTINTGEQEFDGYTTLMLAIKGGSTEMVTLLLEKGAQGDMATLLTLAAKGTNTDIVTLLIEHFIQIGTPREEFDRAITQALCEPTGEDIAALLRIHKKC